MTKLETLTIDELATSLAEVLDRVRGGDQFHIVRDGEIIAMIIPGNGKPGITWGEFLAKYHELPRPDPGFADDLEDIQANQGIAEMPEWPD
jgi:antitoxin (DNA-binding transcriptional repressor) of toxin-antitoxin stability system